MNRKGREIGHRVELRCSFCGKSQEEVKKLVAGPGVYICDECVHLCNEVLEDELEGRDEVQLENLPKPREIKAYLDCRFSN